MKRLIAILILSLFAGTISFGIFYFESFIFNSVFSMRWIEFIITTMVSLVIIEIINHKYIQEEN